MHMGLVTRWFSHEKDKHAPADYIDLSEYAAAERTGESATTLIRVAEITKYEDLKEFTGFVYDGSILVLDVKKVMADEIALKRVTNDLRKLAADVGGDVAGLGDNLIVITPVGTKVDRRKLRVNSS